MPSAVGHWRLWTTARVPSFRLRNPLSVGNLASFFKTTYPSSFPCLSLATSYLAIVFASLGPPCPPPTIRSRLSRPWWVLTGPTSLPPSTPPTPPPPTASRSPPPSASSASSNNFSSDLDLRFSKP